ncbi:MAG: molybdate ABC transporter permease subunit [Myxococcota bacterium]
MSSSELSPLWLSLEVALLATLIATPFAVALGYGLARHRLPLPSLIGAFLFLPVVLPPVITGLLLLRVVGRASPLGGVLAGMGVPLSFSKGGAVLAALVVGFPFFVMMTRAAFASVDPRLEEVSLSLGVSRGQTFLRVTLPLALPGIVGGAVLAFARALGEFGATVVLAGNLEGQTRTLSLAVYTLLDAPRGESTIWPLVLASVLCSLVSLVLYEGLMRLGQRRMELHEPR